jgi:integrase
MKVSLLKKPIDEGRSESLFLMWSRPVEHPDTGKMVRRHYLGIHVPVSPRSPEDRQHKRMLIESAEKKRKEVELSMVAGDLSFLSKKRKPSGKKISEYWEDYSKSRPEGTQGAYLNALRHFTDFTGDIDIAAVTPEVIKGFQFHMLSKLGTNTAANNELVFRAVLNAAYREGLMTHRVTEKVKAISTIDVVREHVTDGDIEALRSVPYYRTVLWRAGLWGAYTGMRASDAMVITRSMLRQQGDEWTYPFRQTKTGGAVYMPIHPKALEMIDWTIPEDDVQFPKLKFLLYGDANHMQKWLGEAGIKKPITYHSLRHGFCVRLLEGGTDLYTIMHLMGHRDINTTMRYLHMSDKLMREAVGRLK